MDLENLTVEELEKLSRDAFAAAKKKRERQKKELRAQIEGMIKAAGFDINEIFWELNDVDLKPILMAQYRDPENEENTWTGQGRRPKWLVAAMEAGRELEEFKIRR